MENSNIAGTRESQIKEALNKVGLKRFESIGISKNSPGTFEVIYPTTGGNFSLSTLKNLETLTGAILSFGVVSGGLKINFHF